MQIFQTINPWIRRVPTWVVYILGIVPAVWLIWAALTGGLGIDPTKRLEHELGEIALQFFIATMAISPALRFLRLNLIKFRRALGLLTFTYVSLHLSVWLFLDIQLYWSEIWKDILKRPYITIGMAAFVMLLPLAITSNDLSIRRLGAGRWTKLHMLAYPAALFGGLHYVMVTKTWEVEALIYFVVILCLLAIRSIKLTKRFRLQA